jgi:hypothetical protein
MSQDDSYCQACAVRFQWYETTCPRCGAELVNAEDESGAPGEADPLLDEELVSVFESDDAGEADVVRAALEQEGIDCALTGPQPFLAEEGGPSAVLVALHDADRARALLKQLDDAASPASPPEPVPPPSASHPSDPPGLATIYLHDAETGQFIGRISETDLDFLCARLEEDADAPQTYYIGDGTIDLLSAQGAGAALVGLLRGALRGREGAEIRWSDGE